MLDVHNSKTAFRRAKLIRRPLEGQPGSTFMFSINNRPIYAGGESVIRLDTLIDDSGPSESTGSNWIPTDQILPMIEPDRYTKLLEMAASPTSPNIPTLNG